MKSIEELSASSMTELADNVCVSLSFHIALRLFTILSLPLWREGRGRGVLSLSKNFLQLGLQCIAAEAVGNDFSVGADEKCGGDGIDAVGLGSHCVPCLQVAEVVPRHAEALDGSSPSLVVLVETESHDVKTFGVVFLIGSLHVGHLP